MEFMGTETVDDFFSGQAAALSGGTTMHIDFVIPVNGSLTAGFNSYVKKTSNSVMDFGFHMAVTKWDEDISKEMEIMVKEKGSHSLDLGISSSKFFSNFVFLFAFFLSLRDQLFQILHGLQRITHDQRRTSSPSLGEVQISWSPGHGSCREWRCCC